MPKNRKDKNFLKSPQYPGGKQALNEFIQKNMRYPAEALKNKVQGTVLVGFDVRDTGQVQNAHVIHGIGYGCDQEALRLVRMLQFASVKNRGVRLSVSRKIKIRFNLSTQSAAIVYNYTQNPQKKTQPQPAQKQKPNKQTSYTYTISF